MSDQANDAAQTQSGFGKWFDSMEVKAETTFDSAYYGTQKFFADAFISVAEPTVKVIETTEKKVGDAASWVGSSMLFLIPIILIGGYFVLKSVGFKGYGVSIGGK